MSKVKIKLNDSSEAKLKEGLNTLKTRGVNKPELGPFIDELLATEFAKETLNEYIDSITPIDWKLKMLGSDPEFQAEISDLVSKQKFGVDYKKEEL